MTQFIGSTTDAPFTPKTYVGVDNGFTGAMFAFFPDERFLFMPSKIMDLGKEKILDFEENRAFLRQIIAASGNSKDRILAVYEQSNPNPLFGSRNNYTNGKNGEFWRLLLTAETIPFMLVNPKCWQKAVFAGIRGDDTKIMARLVRQQRFPHLQLDGYNREQICGITDALCIALWARELKK